jgi:hypothetical protein
MACTGTGGQGCRCAFHVHKREYMRTYMRAYSARKRNGAPPPPRNSRGAA